MPPQGITKTKNVPKPVGCYLAMAFTYHRTGRRFKYDLHIDFQSRNIPLPKKKTPMDKRILNPSPLEKSGNFS